MYSRNLVASKIEVRQIRLTDNKVINHCLYLLGTIDLALQRSNSRLLSTGWGHNWYKVNIRLMCNNILPPLNVRIGVQSDEF